MVQSQDSKRRQSRVELLAPSAGSKSIIVRLPSITSVEAVLKFNQFGERPDCC